MNFHRTSGYRLSYNAKLQPTSFDISGGVVHQNYDYYNDGRISFVHNTTDATFDRKYTYDQMGRLTENKTGGQARNDSGQVPYYESFGYDAFSNLTARESDSWNLQSSATDSALYSNNRRSGWGYDSDGRNTAIDSRTMTFDASGQQTNLSATAVAINGSNYTINQANNYDADGAMGKEVDTQSNAPGTETTTYYLRSTVLGGAIIEELNSSGQKNVGYVCLPGGQLLAKQSGSEVIWKHNTAAGTGEYTTNSADSGIGRTEFDPLGADISLSAPPAPEPFEDPGEVGAGHVAGIMDARWSNFFNTSSGCSSVGVAASCSGSMALTNLDAEMRATFGYHFYDLPGYANEGDQGESRYLSIINGEPDPEMGRHWGTIMLTYASGAVRTLKNPTLDELAEAEHTPDSSAVDLENNIVTIYAGSEYLEPQNTSPPSLTDAIAAAKNALKDPNSDCAKLFSKLNGLDLLNKGKIQIKDTSVPKNLSSNGKLSGNYLVGAVTKGNDIYINPSARTTLGTHAPISNGVYRDSSGLFDGFSPLQVLAAIIIHEELHKSGDFETETGSSAAFDSMANSSNVINTCFKKSGP